MRILMILVFTALCNNLSAQIEFAGRLYDAENNEGISGAKVVIKGSNMVAYTSDDGSFYFKNVPITKTVIGSHPQYSTRSIISSSDTLQLGLRPLGKEPQLNEAMILTSRVGDFEFYDQLLFILGRSGQEVRIMDKDGHLEERTLTPYRFNGLYKDCLGNLYAYNNDSAFIVRYNYRDIIFERPVSRVEFDEFILPCQDYFREGLLFAVSRRRNLVTSLKYGPRGGQVSTFQEIADSNALKLLNENYNRDYFERQGLRGESEQLFMGEMSDDQLAEKQEEVKLDWFDSFVIRPNKVYIFAEDDHFSLFDLKSMKQFYYQDPLEDPIESKLNFSRENAQRMLKDPVTGKLYIVYRNKSMVELKSLKSKNRDYHIQKYPFPEKVKIYNGQLYFISNPSLDGSYYLYKW